MDHTGLVYLALALWSLAFAMIGFTVGFLFGRFTQLHALIEQAVKGRR